MEPSKSKAFAVLVALFLGGFISGALALRVYHQQIAEPDRIDLHSQPGVVAQHLHKELALTEAQKAQVQEILDDCIMREADLLMQAKHLRVEAKERILEVLDDEQRKKFASVIEGSASH